MLIICLSEFCYYLRKFIVTCFDFLCYKHPFYHVAYSKCVRELIQTHVQLLDEFTLDKVSFSVTVSHLSSPNSIHYRYLLSSFVQYVWSLFIVLLHHSSSFQHIYCSGKFFFKLFYTILSQETNLQFEFVFSLNE